jgi:hypothetical protein
LAIGKPTFIRPTHINAALCTAAAAVYNITKNPKDLARFSPHSIWVGACIALHAAGVQFHDQVRPLLVIRFLLYISLKLASESSSHD